MLYRTKIATIFVVVLSMALLSLAATCPDGTTAATVAQCPCLNEAALTNFIIVTSGPGVVQSNLVANIDAVWGVAMAVYFDYKVPGSGTPSCAGRTYDSAWVKSFSWAVLNDVTNVPVTLRLATSTDKQRIVFPAWTFTEGNTYRVEATVTDQNNNAITTIGRFRAVSPTPSGTVDCPLAGDDNLYPHLDHCKCAGDAVLDVSTITNGGGEDALTNEEGLIDVGGGVYWVKPTADAVFSVEAAYETPATFTPEDASNTHCKSAVGAVIEFDEAMDFKWTLTDVTNPALPAVVQTPVGTISEITIPANTLTLGNQYTLTLNITGFFGLYEVRSVSFTADYEAVECPDGSEHGDLKLCPCVSQAVFTHVIRNAGNTLPNLVSSQSMQTFTHLTTWEVPAGNSDCAGTSFTAFLTNAQHHPLLLPDWEVIGNDNIVLSAATKSAQIVMTSLFTAGTRYRVKTTFYDAFGVPNTKYVQFVADFSLTPITCPGSTWAMSKPKHCPCFSQATFTTPPTLTSPQFKQIFDRSLAMTVTGTATLATDASATADLGIACTNVDFSSFLTYSWASTPAIAPTPLVWDLATETSTTVTIAAEKFVTSTTYALEMTATFPETNVASSGTALTFFADDCVHYCPDNGANFGYCVSVMTHCPCSARAVLEDRAVTKTGAVTFPRIMAEGEDFELSSTAVLRVPATYSGAPEYGVQCPSLNFGEPPRLWKLNDITEGENEVLLPAGTVDDLSTITFSAHSLLLGHTYTASVTFSAFNGQTATLTTPSFLAETFVVTCPDGSRVRDMTLCPCATKAVVTGLTILNTVNGGVVPKVILPTSSLTLNGATMYKVPAANVDNEHGVACSNVNFIQNLAISWTVHDLTSNTNFPLTMTSNAMTITFPSGTFTVGHKYRATVSFTDIFSHVYTSSAVVFQADTPAVLCPDGVSNVAERVRCPCVEEAEIHDAVITRGSECPPDFVYHNAGLVLHTSAKYTTLRCSEASCRNQNFYGWWKSMQWKLEDVTNLLNVIVMSNGITTSEIRFPEHTFAAGHRYKISVTYVDLLDRPTTVSHEFEGRYCPALCPDGTCEETHKWCRCIDDAVLGLPTIATYQLQTTVAGMVDVALAWGLDSNTTYVTPALGTAAGCANVRFDRYWLEGSEEWMRPPTKFPMATVSWAVYDTTLQRDFTLPDDVVTTLTRIQFPANLFTVGHTYTATVTFQDATMGRTSSRVFPFEVVERTPVITMTTKATVRTTPRNIRIVSSVTDGYADGSNPVWNCQLVAGGACPAALTTALGSGTRSGVTIAGPIPANSYEIWMTYRGVRGATVTVIVECDDSELLSDQTCPQPCTYTCPDGTCSSKLSSCKCALEATITDAAIAVWPTLDEQSTAVTFTASATYRHIGSCAAFDFAPFMTVKWYLFRGYNRFPEVLPTSIVSTALKFVIPDNFLVEGATYTLSVAFTDINGAFVESVTHTFTVKTFPPIVSVTPKGQMIATGPRNINISAVVIDKHADSTAGTWSCTTDSNGVCPTSVTSALANGKNTGVFISGPVAAGTYVLRMTYKGVTSDSLRLQVSSAEIPRVLIQASTSSLSQSSLLYTTSQTLHFAASVRFENKTTFEWTVNGVSYGTDAVLSLPASALLVNTALKPRTNLITVRASSVNDTSIFGDATVRVVVVPEPKLYLMALTHVGAAYYEPLVLLSSVVKLEYDVADAPADTTMSFEVGYLVDGTKSAVVRTQSMSASFVTPMADVTATKMTFYVDMRINGVLLQSVQADNAVSIPSVETLCSLQVTEVEATTSAEANKKRAAILNLGYLAANCTSSASQNAVLNNLASLQSDDVAAGPVVASLSRVLGSMTNDTVSDAAVEAKATSFLVAVAGKMSASESTAFMEAVSKLNASAALNNAMETVAKNIAGQANFGETVSVESTDQSTVLAGTKLTASSAQGMSLSTASSSISGNLVPGVAEDAVVTVTATVRNVNAYGDSEDGQPRSSDVVSYSVGVNGAAHEVKDLEDALLITFNSKAGKGAVCQYYDTTLGKWSTEGTWLYAFNTTTVTCATTHLTTFTTFGSSAATIIASLFAVVVAVVMQLWAQ